MLLFSWIQQKNISKIIMCSQGPFIISQMSPQISSFTLEYSSLYFDFFSNFSSLSLHACMQFFFFLLHTFTLSSKNFILIEKRKGSKSISFLNICNFILNLSFVCNPPCESCPFEFMCLFKKTKQNNNLENSLGKREKKNPFV